MLKKGDRGPAVRDLQLDLNTIKLLPEDGIFGDWTDQTVRVFQDSRGLNVDGIVGPQTHAALEHELSEIPTTPFTLSLYTRKSADEILSTSSDAWLHAAVSLGFTTLYIQTNSQGEGHTLSKMGGPVAKREERLRDVCDHVRTFGLEPQVYQWAPREEQIAPTFLGGGEYPYRPLAELLLWCDVSICDWGEEGANDLSEEDMAVMRRFLAEQPANLYWTWDTHAGRYNVRASPMLSAPEIAGGTCQAYHSYDLDNPGEWWGREYGPGAHQRYALEKVGAVRGERPGMHQSIILALYDQYDEDAVVESGYSTHPGVESVMEGVNVIWSAGIRDLRFWRDRFVLERWTLEAFAIMRERGMIASPNRREKLG